MRKNKLNSFCLQQVLDQILLEEAGGCEIFGLSGRNWMEEAENGLGDLQPAQERDNRVQMHCRFVRANREGV